jgi:uncharacterized ion transporter superfamily protein YfcC
MTAAAPPAEDTPAKRGFRLPSAYTILFILIVVVAALTWVIPAGRYDYNDDGTPIPGTYHGVEQNPARILVDSVTAPINGLYGIESAEDGSINYYNSGELFGAIDVALFIFVIGGFLGVTHADRRDPGRHRPRRGAAQGSRAADDPDPDGRSRDVSTYGMAEESLAFYVLVITVMVAAGYDSLTGASLLMLGCGIGVIGSTINPFATGIASGFAGTGIDEGLIGRIVILVVGTAIGIWWVMRYAARVKADPGTSLIAADRAEIDAYFRAAGGGDGETAAMTGRQKIVLALFFLAFVVMIIGVVPWSDLGITRIPTKWWWFPEMTASFLVFAILIGLAGRMPETKFVETFVDGSRDLLGVALIIGIARGVTVIMTNGQITDTVLNAAEQAVSGLGGVAFINLMFGMFIPLSFLIPSSSGLATVAMPIMATLASFANVPEELVVTAFQTGNGIVNLVTPTSAVVMGGLAIARVGYGTWPARVAPCC